MDEYFETKKNIDQQKIEIKKIRERFKELKTLVYDYKDLKEKEILNLNDSQSRLKNEIDIQKTNYESLVDKATMEIESFIKKHDTENVQ